jgi:flagellar protein FliL
MATPVFPELPIEGLTPPKKGPSLIVQGGILLALTLVAAGMGWATGGQLTPTGGATPQAEAPADAHGASGGHGEAKSDGHGGGGEHGEAAAPLLPGHPMVVPLAPINVNLAAPSDVWLRLELALEFPNTPEPGVADSVHQDLLAFTRTLKLYQIEGPRGIVHLKADLDERAKLRSAGKVARVLIRTMLFE